VRTIAELLVQFINVDLRVIFTLRFRIRSRKTSLIKNENVGVASTRGERRRAGAHSATRERVLKKWVAVDWAGGGAGRQAGKKSGSN
jgi:hypothetical protein